MHRLSPTGISPFSKSAGSMFIHGYSENLIHCLLEEKQEKDPIAAGQADCRQEDQDQPVPFYQFFQRQGDERCLLDSQKDS